MHNRDIISGLFFLGVGILFSTAAVCIPLGSFSNPGPGLVPFFPGAILAILSVVLVVRALIARSKQGGNEATSEEPMEPLRVPSMVIITLGTMLLYAFAIELMGFIVSSLILMLLTFRFGGALSWRKSFIGMVASVGICYVVFQLWLGVQFPRGPWGF